MVVHISGQAASPLLANQNGRLSPESNMPSPEPAKKIVTPRPGLGLPAKGSASVPASTLPQMNVPAAPTPASDLQTS